MTEGSAPRAPHREVPWRRLLLIGGAVAVAVWLLVGLGSRPLDHGSMTGIRDFSYSESGDVDPPIRRLQYETGQAGTVIASLSNNASFTVTVTQIELFPGPGGAPALMVQDEVSFEPEPRDGVVGERRSLEDHEARLGPNRQIRVYIEAHFEGCEFSEPGFAMGFGQMTVHYRYLGLPRTSVISLPQQLEIPAPESCHG